MKFNKQFLYGFLLLIIAWLGYYEISFFRHTLKWDVIDQYYPWRMYVVQCLRNGFWPLWNPFEQFGYPMHADPQSGVWYPVVWLFSLFGPYTLYSVQMEFMLHVTLGSIGMMLFLQKAGNRQAVSFFLAVCYLFCGLFIGNAQHITFTIAACWIPFILYSFIRLYQSPGIKSALRFALFGYLLLSGGYPAFTIILFYVLMICSLLLLVNNRNNSIWIRQFLTYSLAAVVLLVLASSALLYSVWQSSDYLSRAEGLSYKVASFGPYSPQSLLSFLFPLASAKEFAFFDTDISMSSTYIGIIAFAGFIAFLFIRKSPMQWLLLAATLLITLISFGKYTPFHKVVYSLVPMMDLFRFPSVFRLYIIIGVLMMAGIYFSNNFRIADFRNTLIVLLLFAAGVSFYLLGAAGRFPDFSGWNSFINALSLKQAFVFQGFFQSAAIALLLLLLLVIKDVNTAKKWLLIAGIAEVMIAAQFNIPITAINENKTRQTAEELKTKAIEDFPLPEIRPMILNNDSGAFMSPFWRNLNLFKKQPAWDGYNSFQLKNYIRFVDDEKLRNSQLQNNWIYFADSVIFFHDSINTDVSRKNVVYISDMNRNNFPLPSPGNNKFSLVAFNPEIIEMNTEISGNIMLTLMQQYYHGWKVYVNGEERKPIVGDYLFMCVPLHEGDKNVQFRYENKPVKNAARVSAITLLLMAGLWISLSVKRKNN
ncbi:MAG: hypothetical protein JSS90_03725 [Bacteroidetes bacterium]|nr:hypothetical protein [Bacteroidota bacterium]